MYDLLTGDYAYGAWVRELVALARGHGLLGDRALDVACGNGNGTLPLLDLGYEVSGCDLSPAMLRRRAAAHPRPRPARPRPTCSTMPVLGRFDLVTCFGDVPNHLASLARGRHGALAGSAATCAAAGCCSSISICSPPTATCRM